MFAGWFYIGVVGGSPDVANTGAFTGARSAQHPLWLDIPLSSLSVQQNDLGDVLKIPVSVEIKIPSESTTFMELYVLVDDELLGTSRYPSTGYLGESPGSIAAGDFARVTTDLYLGSYLWVCDESQRVVEVTTVGVLWNDSGRAYANGPGDGGNKEGLWFVYRSIRDGGTPPPGVSRLNFEEGSMNFIAGMPFFAVVDATDDGSQVEHAGSFEHFVTVQEDYLDFPAAPSPLVIFPSDVARLTLNGFEPVGLWVAGGQSVTLPPPERFEFASLVGTARHTGPPHLNVAHYDQLWWVNVFGEQTLFPDQPDIAAQFLFSWDANTVPIGDEQLCNDEFNVADVSPPDTEIPPPSTGTVPRTPGSTPILTPTPTPTEPVPTATSTPSEPVPTATLTPTETPAATTTVYNVEIFVANDPAGHAGFIGQMPGQITVTVTGDTITVSGGNAFVSVSGELAGDGSFTATGSGTVAGFSGTSVSFTGQLTGSGITAEYEMGVNGNLPTGQSITYSVR